MTSYYHTDAFPLIILAGPTASGKSDLAVKLASEIGGEIISADSMQVYRGMDIGTAKIMPEEMGGIPHHLIDILEPDEEFHVVRFQKLARKAIHDICGRGRIPILVGGTGFYIQAVVYDIDFTDAEQNTIYREQLEDIAVREGPETLYRMLEETDPEAAHEIHPNNVKRVIRALEFYKETGEKISEHNAREKQRSSPYCPVFFVLTDNRENLYRKIDRRVDKMMEAGLLEEVKTLRDRGFTKDMVSMQGLGYKEMFRFLEGEISLEEAVRILKRDTRHFAKRQLTWFRREKDVIWIDREKYENRPEAMLEDMLKIIRERMNLQDA